MDDIAARVNIFDGMIPVTQNFSDCLIESILKLSAYTCEFGTAKIDYLRRTITRKGISPDGAKMKNFLGQIKKPNSETSETPYWLCNFPGLLFLIVDKNYCHFTNFYARKRLHNKK